MTSGLSSRAMLALSRRGVFGAATGLIVAGAAAGGAAARQVTSHSIADFFERDAIIKAAMSPSGAHIALIRETWDGGYRRAVLDVLDAANPSAPPRRSPIGDVDCETMEWASDERLLVGVALRGRTRTERVSASSLGSIGGELMVSRRMLSIEAQTGAAVVMFEGETQRMRNTHDLGQIADLLHDDPDHVLMIAPTQARGIPALYKVNILTGKAEEYERGDFDTWGWQTHNGIPVLRYDVNSSGNAFEIMGRAPGERSWNFLSRVPIFDAPEWKYVAATERSDVILVAARLDGEDVQTVRELNLKTREYGPPLARREKADVFGGLTDDRGGYLGAIYYGDRLEYEFAKPELAPHHRAMNRFFDNECNVALVDIDRTLNRFLAYVTGPREPGAWYLYDRAARSFVNLAPRTALAAERLGKAEGLDVATRDGATIRAYLTAPPSGAPGPLIVMPHGGPELRDTLGWDRTAQTLAAQGWWVLQPNFRGSGGYGRTFASDGYRRWGDRMQEDIEDAVAQVIRDKGLDGAKVGIMGASYGGYAALMGAVRRPDLYKAAVGICGVYDLPDMLAAEQRGDDTPENSVYKIWVRRIGDPRADRAALEQASPTRQAGKVTCPVMLVHGSEDRVVPVFQSRRMKDALNQAGGEVEYVEIRGGGHGDWEDDVEKVLMTAYIELFRRAFA